MTRGGFGGVGLLLCGVLGATPAWAEVARDANAAEMLDFDDVAELREFVGSTDAELDAIAETQDTPDTDELKGLSDLDALLDPELAVVFDANPTDVCTRTDAEVQALAYNRSTRISLRNQGGLFDAGVCWWHSRLQRSSLYLATYRPDLPMPTRKQAKAIINTLANMNRVVVIPGYSNFNQFSEDYEKEILARLEAWQRFDGFVGFRWIDGLIGRWNVAPKTLELIMSRIHDLITVKHRILFEKLAFKGLIGAHAYLVIGSRKTAQGYEIDVIDSNYPSQTVVVTYVKGQRSLFVPGSSQAFVPYLDFRKDPNKIAGTLKRFCK